MKNNKFLAIFTVLMVLIVISISNTELPDNYYDSTFNYETHGSRFESETTTQFQSSTEDETTRGTEYSDRFNSTSYYTTTERYSTTTFTTTQKTSDNQQSESPFLKTKNKGDCRELKGNVVVTFILLDTPEGKWNEADISQFKTVQDKATRSLNAEAAQNGVSLNVRLEYIPAAISSYVNHSSYDESLSDALKAAGLPGKEDAIYHLKEKYGCDEAPIIFTLNFKDRSFASNQSADRGFEFAIIFNEKNEGANYRHELLHIFGAQDFYYPDEVKKHAKDDFYDSVMLGMVTETVVDSFTQYLIGWDLQMDSEAQSFFDKIDHVSAEDISAALRESMKTGFATVKRDNGTYTGYLKNGVEEGKGKMVWDNGDSYDGDWVYGAMHGYGVYIYSDGGRYEGNWSESNFNGYGVFYYKNGSKYEGNWSEGETHGYGKMTFDDGGTYEGDFYEGSITGKGTLKWPDGSVYTGEVKDGSMHGYGTLTYADGNKRTGNWDMGNFLG